MTATFLSGAGLPGVTRARLEGPRRPYATPGPKIGTTRALRRRQLLTNHSHAALPWRVSRASQRDSSSKWPAGPPGADALKNTSTPTRERLAYPHRPRDRGSLNHVLDGASFPIRGKVLVNEWTSSRIAPGSSRRRRHPAPKPAGRPTPMGHARGAATAGEEETVRPRTATARTPHLS